jgi:hypothetical protein
LPGSTFPVSPEHTATSSHDSTDARARASAAARVSRSVGSSTVAFFTQLSASLAARWPPSCARRNDANAR